MVIGIFGDNGGTRRGFRGEDTLNFEVRESVYQLALLMSTKTPKCLKKSVPRIGCCTSATMNIHSNARLSPGLRVRDFLPYVRIGGSLTAAKVSLSGGCLRRSKREERR